MLDIEKDTAKRIIDALAVAIDGKPSSAKSFNQCPYEDLADYGNWGQDNNDSKRDTPRTRALFMAYLVFSGGRIPLRGIEMHGSLATPPATGSIRATSSPHCPSASHPTGDILDQPDWRLT